VKTIDLYVAGLLVTNCDWPPDTIAKTAQDIARAVCAVDGHDLPPGQDLAPYCDRCGDLSHR